MRYYRKHPAVEFEIQGDTYRVEPEYNSNTCVWWKVGKDVKNHCPLDDPSFQILMPDEDWPFAMELYSELNTEDTKIHGEFLTLLNKAVRHFLPKGHPKWCPEKSEKYLHESGKR